MITFINKFKMTNCCYRYDRIFVGLLFFLVILVIVCYGLNSAEHKKSYFVQSVHKKSLQAHALLYLPSLIPNCHVAATRQFLDKIELRRVDLALLSEREDGLALAEPLMDKVLIIPKSFKKKGSAVF